MLPIEPQLANKLIHHSSLVLRSSQDLFPHAFPLTNPAVVGHTAPLKGLSSLGIPSQDSNNLS